jgi:transcriptional regulator with XRE-family HTH domain
MKGIPKTLGQRIRYIRGDLTQVELAEAVGIRQAMVSRYEADKETPSPRVLLRMAIYSGKSIEWLLTGKELAELKGKKKPSKKRRAGKSATRSRKK